MVADAKVRRAYLEKLKTEKQPKYTRLIYYKNDRRPMGVYEIDLDIACVGGGWPRTNLAGLFQSPQPQPLFR